MSPRSREVSEEMRTQSRAALLAATRKLFAQQGYFNCRISDIANEAGMSQGNVYWYFSGKEDLLKAVLADTFDNLGARIAAAASGTGTAIEKLDQMVDSLMEFSQKHSDLTTIMLSLLGQGGTPSFSNLGFDMDQIERGYIQVISSIIADARAEGTIDDQGPAEFTAMIFFGLFNGLNLIYGQEWMQIPPEIIKSHIFRLFGFNKLETS